MEAYRRNNIAKNILAVVFGIIAAILAFIVSTVLLFMTGVLSWKDGGPELTQSNFSLSVLIVIATGSIVGGLTTSLHSKTNYFLYSTITGVSLLIIWIGTDFDLSYYDTFDIVCVLCVLPFTSSADGLANSIKRGAGGNNLQL